MRKNDIFANRLQIALAATHTKKSYLAQALQKDPSQITRYCSGDIVPPVEVIEKIADILEVNRFWLQGYDIADVKEEVYKDGTEAEKLNCTEEEFKILCDILLNERTKHLLMIFCNALQDGNGNEN